MPADQSFIIVLAVCAVLLAMVVLFALSFRFNVLLLLGAVFIILAPFSLILGPLNSFLKFARIGCAVAMVVAGIFGSRRGRFGRTSLSFLPFAALFTLSALWSDSPFEAFIYKGQFGLLALAGVLAGSSLRSEASLRQGTRLLLLASCAWAATIGANLFSHPGSVGRLAAYGLNPNGLGICSAFCFLFSLYSAFFDGSRFLKWVGYISASLNALIVVSTGSRGAVLMCAPSAIVMMLPLLKHPKRVIGVILAITILGMVVWNLVDPTSAKHLGDSGTDRAENWAVGLTAFAKSPIWGCGWLSWYGTTYNSHMAYIQILAETGALGLLMFAASLFILIFSNVHNYVACGYAAVSRAPVFLAASLLTAMLLDGACYIGPVVGSSSDLLIFALVIGLVDQIPHLIAEQQAIRELEFTSAWDSMPMEGNLQWEEHQAEGAFSSVPFSAYGGDSAFSQR